MAYDANLYNPYGFQAQSQFQQSFPRQQMQPQQPVNGLTFIDAENIDSYWLPNGSVSQPLFIDAEHFIIKSFDSNGGSSTEAYKATKVPLSSILKSSNNTVTREDLEAFKAEIMEAINGGNPVANVSAETPASATQ